jgi:DNA-binding GntR family transcriptional regulator
MIAKIADRQQSMRDRVYEEVRRAIITGQLRPGEIIREADLGRRYGMSRTPVREALCMLSFRGLLSALPRTGYLVNAVSLRDVQEMHHLRKLLEVEAARLACGRITPEDLAELERVMTSRSGDQALDENRVFHMTIARASGSARLANLISNLLDEMNRIQALDPHIATPSGPYEHADLVEALRRGDVEAAQRAMADHVDGAMARILECFPVAAR